MRLRGTNRNFRRVSPRVPFNPRKLFRNGEQGVHYDPSALGTLFQDSAGTTPVTAVEQPVGLMLDRRLGTARGPELATATYTTPAGFDNVTTSLSSTSFTQVAGTTPGRSYVTLPVTVGAFYEVSCRIASVSTGTVSVLFRDSPAGTARYTSPAVGAGAVVRFVSTAFAVGTVVLWIANTAGAACTVDSITIKEIPGNHAFQTTAIDRPILRQDAGGNFYLACNGTNTWMQTNSIDFTGTDKVTVFAGLRKLSDAATGVVAEIGADSFSVNGSFGLFAPAGSGSFSYRIQARGTNAQAAGGSVFAPAPDTAVVRASANIVGDQVSIARNAVLVSQVVGDLGTGNYGNYPLYLFRRGGTSLPFNGNFYGLVIRGALTSDPDTLKMERWLSLKTGVQL